jgi:hypothetical protein
MKHNFTESQVKALLIAASTPDPRPARPYSDLLDHAVKATTPVDDLRRIKEQAKELAKDAPDARHRESAQLLYHVAVASAFVHHAAEISGRPMHKQQQVYERLAEAWSGSDVGTLFREAAAHITRKKPVE